jgi:hypothetical protein
LVEPRTSDVIGSMLTCVSWIRPHWVHLNVQCSKPDRAALTRWTSVHDWHLGQRGRAATRGDNVDVCGSGIACFLPGWIGDALILPSASAAHCSILHNLRKKFQTRHVSDRDSAGEPWISGFAVPASLQARGCQSRFPGLCRDVCFLSSATAAPSRGGIAPLAGEIRALSRDPHRRILQPNRHRPHRDAASDRRGRQ